MNIRPLQNSVKSHSYHVINVKFKMHEFLTKIKKDLNLTCSISPHKWRHTLATELVRNNISINKVQKVLGHSTLTITQKYIHMTEKNRRNNA